MKKTLLQAAVFPALWLLYCAAVMLPNPQTRTSQAALGVVAGVVFLAAAGLLLLAAARRRRYSTRALVVFFVLLVALDQIAKLLVLRFLPQGTQLTLAEGWLFIRFAPNYSNNVLFNLLGIQLASRWADLAFKLVSLLLGGGVAVWFFRQNSIGKNSTLLPVSVALLAAGAASSLIDTAHLGYVLDFIVLSPLVAFDFKDLYLQFGIGLLAIAMIEEEYGQKKDSPGATPPEDTPPSKPPEE